MTPPPISRRSRLPLLAAFIAIALPATAQACACGCGIFDVGDGTLIPQASDSGFSVFYRYAYMDQSRNFEQGHTAPATDNSDQRIATSFHTLGAEYMISPRWAVMAQLPIYDRHFTTSATDDAGNTANVTFPLTAAGDAMVQLTYTGLSPDMSNGLTFGVKLPTGRTSSPTYGNYTQNPPYDPDTMPGTGSTDILVGGYHVGHIGAAAHWFAQAQYKIAVATRNGYRPGNEIDSALGVSYDLATGGATKLSPTLQLLGSVRARDSGVNAVPLNSGYQRLLVAPGLRVQLTRKLSLYADVELPVAQYVNSASPADQADSMGQLVAPALFKMQVNYGF